MLNEYQEAKLIEWAEWREVQPDDGCMPHGIGIVDGWVEGQIVFDDLPFPTAEQMEPTPADFGLDD